MAGSSPWGSRWRSYRLVRDRRRVRRWGAATARRPDPGRGESAHRRDDRCRGISRHREDVGGLAELVAAEVIEDAAYGGLERPVRLGVLASFEPVRHRATTPTVGDGLPDRHAPVRASRAPAPALVPYWAFPTAPS